MGFLDDMVKLGFGKDIAEAITAIGAESTKRKISEKLAKYLEEAQKTPEGDTVTGGITQLDFLNKLTKGSLADIARLTSDPAQIKRFTDLSEQILKEPKARMELQKTGQEITETAQKMGREKEMRPLEKEALIARTEYEKAHTGLVGAQTTETTAMLRYRQDFMLSQIYKNLQDANMMKAFISLKQAETEAADPLAKDLIGGIFYKAATDEVLQKHMQNTTGLVSKYIHKGSYDYGGLAKATIEKERGGKRVSDNDPEVLQLTQSLTSSAYAYQQDKLKAEALAKDRDDNTKLAIEFDKLTRDDLGGLNIEMLKQFGYDPNKPGSYESTRWNWIQSVKKMGNDELMMILQQNRKKK